MTHLRETLLQLIMVSVVFLAAGCSDNGTAPDDKKSPPTGDLTHSWSNRYGDAAMQAGSDVAIDASGNTIVTGCFNGTVNFGGGDLVGAGQGDIFVAKFGPGGSHIWSKRFGDGDEQSAVAAAVDASGNVIITGSFWGTVDFGGGALTSAGAMDIFIAKFTPNGDHIWSDRFGGITGVQSAGGLAFDPSGNVFLIGSFYGGINFGGDPITAAGPSDIFVAKFDPLGTHLWSAGLGGPASDHGYDVAADASGNIIIVGEFEETVNFGDGPLISAGSIDIFVAKFASDGSHIWSNRFGDPHVDRACGVALDASGNVIITGYFRGLINFGGGSLTSVDEEDAFLAKLTSSGGHLWSKRFGGNGYDGGADVAVDASGRVVLIGNFWGSVDFGGGNFNSAGDQDIFLARFTPSGTHLWSDTFGDSEGQYGGGVAVDASGNVAITGQLTGSADFGGGVLSGLGGGDVFLAWFDG